MFPFYGENTEASIIENPLYDLDDYNRFLAGEEDYGGGESDYGYGYAKKEKEPLDYSVLSVGVMTLGLILLVELARHRLDHYAAHGRPFFKAVLEGVYSECEFVKLVSGP